MTELVKIFEEWNAKALVVPGKAVLRDRFEKRLKDVVARKRYGYQDENWAKEMRAKFDEMPSELKPGVPIDLGSQLTLTLLFVKDIADHSRQVAPPRLREELMLPVFLVLGRAQDAARAAKKAEIDSTFVGASLFYWWTTTWPFCD